MFFPRSIWIFIAANLVSRGSSVVGEFGDSDYNKVFTEARKLKKNKSSKNTPAPVPAPVSIQSLEGSYVYIGCGGNVFFTTISCDLFGQEDPDLCKIREYAVGKVGSNKEPESEPLKDAENLFFTPDPDTASVIVNPNEVCVLSGTFRYSPTITKDGKIHQIPMASSNGCKQSTENFTFVLKGQVTSDGSRNIMLDFSADEGFTYVRDNPDLSPSMYLAQPYNSGIFGRRHLDKNGDNNSVPVDVFSTSSFVSMFVIEDPSSPVKHPGIDLVWKKSDGGSLRDHVLYQKYWDTTFLLSLVVHANPHAYFVVSPITKDNNNDNECPSFVIHADWVNGWAKDRLEKSIHTIDEDLFADFFPSLDSYPVGEYPLSVIVDAFHNANDGSDLPYHQEYNNCGSFLINMGLDLDINYNDHPELLAYATRHVTDTNGPNMAQGRLLNGLTINKTVNVNC